LGPACVVMGSERGQEFGWAETTYTIEMR